MSMLDALPRALLGFALFVLVSGFAILTAPVLLPTLAILAARRGKPDAGERRPTALSGKPQRITVSAWRRRAA